MPDFFTDEMLSIMLELKRFLMEHLFCGISVVFVLSEYFVQFTMSLRMVTKFL